MHPARLGARTPSAQALGSVALPGWRLVFHKRSNLDGTGKCSLLRTGAEADLAYGVVYALDPADKPALDRAEGVGFGYEEVWLTLDGYGDVFCYVAEADHIDDALAPMCWYHRFVVEGARVHGLPAEYIAAIEAVPCVKDPDEARAALNAAILGGE